MAKIGLCRTEALGGREYRCENCDTSVVVANSCGDRNCPTCRGASRSDWLEQVDSLLLAGIDHYQVVFTMPETLRSLTLGNRKQLFDLLFASAAKTLKTCLAEEHQMNFSSLMVLHTWNQKLEFHPHVHCVVPGTGLSLDGEQVVHAKRNSGSEGDDQPGRYLVDADRLREVFAQCFIEGLERLRQKQQLSFGGSVAELAEDAPWESLISDLQATIWVAHITPPPADDGADAVLKYLARYINGGPIHDSRIIETSDDTVTFWARSGEQTGGQREQQPLSLRQMEFVRRWCLHILPAQYTRVRYYGQWSTRNRGEYLERLSIQLEPTLESADCGEMIDFDPQSIEAETETSGEGLSDEDEVAGCCPNCSGRLIPHRIKSRPSWSQILARGPKNAWQDEVSRVPIGQPAAALLN